MDKYAVIVAGGTGTRMQSNVPKQFIELEGKPVLWHTINTFLITYPDFHLILVVPVDHVLTANDLITKYFETKNIQVVTGGNTRFDSVKNGLAFVRSESIVFIHDAVRCLVSGSLLIRCYKTAMQEGSAVPAIKSKDSIRIVMGKENQVVDRQQIRLIQTPQVFKSSIIIPAFDADYQESFTDEATVVEAAGMRVTLVEGEERNIKITTQADLVIAASILRADRP